MTESRGQGPHGGADHAIDHEIDRRGILHAGVWLAATIVAGFVVASLIYLGLARGVERDDPAPSPIAAARQQPLPPGPQLQARPERELAAYRKAVRERLGGWGWVDRDAGLAHVPIERAIELVAEEAAAPPAPAADAAGATDAGAQ